jgi:predicted nucleotidyltransferase
LKEEKTHIKELEANILRVLLYFDIFNHPLKPEELFIFLPQNSLTFSSFTKELNNIVERIETNVKEKDCYYFPGNNFHYSESRKEKESYSKKHWKVARLMTHLIKRFPFVRAVFITGSLSKNSSSKASDIDFMIVTQKNRLWVARTMLMTFKKLFLFNKYKYFCINYSITEDHLEIEDKNIYTAIEVITSKATYNSVMLKDFINSNLWLKSFMPNYSYEGSSLHITDFKTNNRKSYFQRLIELCFPAALTNKLDKYLQTQTHEYWKKKHNDLTDSDREQMFRTKEGVSKVHPGNMQHKILGSYNNKLKEFNLI